MVTDLQTYLFDLRGYVKLEGALSTGEVAALNAALVAIPRLEPGQWYGRVLRQLPPARRRDRTPLRWLPADPPQPVPLPRRSLHVWPGQRADGPYRHRTR